ncbi:MAG: MBL fold metallo-hydrolase [Candidatus Aenigmarchaeota archaeon]|nr:MBL fold metallo-hydrolase [Candidatus Aenigmarchaeota archaeon]
MRATGGIYIEISGKRLYLDPGPGALVHSRQNNIPIETLDAILLSHVHQDHANDINTMIDAWSEGGKNIKGTLIGSISAIDGFEDIEKIVLDYHKNHVRQIITMDDNDKTDIGPVHITATKTQHSDPKGIGFTIKGEKAVSYIGDSCYFEGLEDYHKDSDILIVNNIFPKERTDADKRINYHMDTYGTLKLLNKINPELVILQHFAPTILAIGPETEARWLEEQTGIKVRAAKDFEIFEF